METEKVIEKIAQYRNKRGYTYENMANELELTPAAYRKIETGETKLTVDRLFRISAILEAPIDDILGIEKNNYTQNNYNTDSVFSQSIENFYQENREITEQLVRAKDELIDYLKKEIAFLKENKISNLK